MRPKVMIAVCSCWLLLPGLGGECAPPNPVVSPQALRILEQNCVRCHNGSDLHGGLDLSRRENLLRGGDNGPVVDLEHPDRSVLLRRVREGSMPPINDGDALTPEQIAVLAEWLAQGAPGDVVESATSPRVTTATPHTTQQESRAEALPCLRGFPRRRHRRSIRRWPWFRCRPIATCSTDSVTP